MKKCSWIRQLLARPATRPLTRAMRKPPHRARLAVEVLEARRVMSALSVTSLLDDGSVGTLRWAVAQGGSNTITFNGAAFSTPQTINLTGGQLELSNTGSIDTITGPAAGLTINGGGLSRVFQVDANVTASISGLTIAGGNSASSGGGVYNSGSLALAKCTVSSNSAGDGGGVFNNHGSLALTNCTVSGNSANFGGGLFNDRGTLALSICTVSGNSAGYCGGLFSFSFGGTATLANTIVAGNTAPNAPDVDGGIYISQGNNLIGVTDGSSGWVSSDLTGTSAQPLNPLLAPLGNYGGPIQTISLLPGSPAIDAGSNALIPAGITTDQRGLPRIVNGIVDIGAFESEGFNLTPAAGSTPQTSVIGTTFANPLAVIVAAINPSEPVNGGIVSFAAQPAANGASAFLSASSAVITGGQAAVTAVPDNADGSYEVVAPASGASASFDLTNTGPIFASLIVNTTSDSLTPGAGLLSLREAVDYANDDRSGNSKITFNQAVFANAQTINLIGGQLELSNTSEMEMITSPKAGVTVNGGGLSGVFQVDALVAASISGLTITGGNSASTGGGVQNSGTLTLTTCTVSGNSAGNSGGVFNSGTLALTSCTVSGNSSAGGGGLYCGGGTITLGNTIVAGNTANNAQDVFGVFTSQGNNLIGETDGSSGWVGSDLTGTSAQPLNPLLAPLGNYGGATQTMPLLPGSPAIDAGNNALIPAGITTDQRGLPRIVNGAVDIGAFESQGFTVTPVAGSTPQTTVISTAFANPLAVIVTAINPSEPVNGGIISFAAHPAANGASAFLSAASAVITGGQAAVTAVPYNADGSYKVVASESGLAASFSLTNTGKVFASLVVNTMSDSLTPGAGLLSLREAVTFANVDSSGNAKITFNNTVFAHAQAINLTGGQLELSNTTETEMITSPKAGVTINGGGLSRVFQVDAMVAASISGLTITGGNSASNGGGVYNLGTATLTNCTVSGNSATNGGGVQNTGTLTMTNCSVSSNAAGSKGGGVFNNYGSISMTKCTISGNSANIGGGVTNYGSLALTNCTVSDNSESNTVYGGGGVRNGRSSTATLTNCTISGNSASYGGGLYNYVHGTATLTNCTVSGNSASGGGGGVFDWNSATTSLTNCAIRNNSALGNGFTTGGGGVANDLSSTATLTNCSISGNSSFGGSSNPGGGGLLDSLGGTSILTNCTVSGNSSSSSGGGVCDTKSSMATLTNCTVTGNTAINGGGLWTTGSISPWGAKYYGTTTLKNCTVSGNSATTNGGGLGNASYATTTLTNCSVSGNSASIGGGISNQGTLNVASSIIFKNQASSAGGGISTTAGSATITDSIIIANQVNSSGTALGGGIDCENSLLSLTNSAVIANQASGATALGGGIYALDSAVSMQNCLVIGNKANGTVLGEGGGIYYSDSDDLLTLLATNVIGNKATTAHDNIFSGI